MLLHTAAWADHPGQGLCPRRRTSAESACTPQSSHEIGVPCPYRVGDAPHGFRVNWMERGWRAQLGSAGLVNSGDGCRADTDVLGCPGTPRRDRTAVSRHWRSRWPGQPPWFLVCPPQKHRSKSHEDIMKPRCVRSLLGNVTVPTAQSRPNRVRAAIQVCAG